SCSNNFSVRQSVLSSNSIQLKQYFGQLNCVDDESENLIRKNNLLKEISISNNLVGLAGFLLFNEESAEGKRDFYQDFLSNSVEKVSESELQLLSAISRSKSISIEDIPDEHFELLLYGLLYSYSYTSMLSDFDIAEFTTSQIQSFPLNHSEVTVKSGIQVANLAFLLFNQQRFAELANLNSVILSQSLFPTSKEKLRHYKALAYAHFSLERFDKSLDLNRNVLTPISIFIKDEMEIEQAKYFQGLYLYRLGKYEQAKNIFEEFYADSTTTIDKALILNDLSVSYYYLGENNKYLQLLLNALSEAEEAENYDIKLTILNNLFNYYTTIGDENSALNYLKIAEEAAIELGDSYQMATIHAFRGVFLWKTKRNPSAALSEFELAIAEFNPESDFFDYIRALKIIGNIYIESDSLEKAKSIFEKVIEESSKRATQGEFISGLVGLTQIAIQQNNLQHAHELLEEIAQYSLSDLDFGNTVKYHSVKAELLFKSGEVRQSYKELRPVIDQVVERAKTSIDSQTGYWVQSDEYMDAFNTMVSILKALNNVEEAVQILDLYKTINDVALYNSPILRANRLSEEDLARDNLLNTQILSLRTQYLNEPDDRVQLQIKSQIDQLSAEREEIFNRIRSTAPSSKINLWNIRNSLKSNELIIHFTEIGSSLYVSFIDRNEIKIETIDFNFSTKNFFESVANDLASSETDLIELYTIFDILNIGEGISTNTSRIAIIPDNYLYRIPLEILPVSAPSSSKSFGSTTYLLEKYEFMYFTSLNEYLTNNRSNISSFSSNLSAFAISDFSDLSVGLPSLPFATQEVQNIDASLTVFNQKNLFVESQATKESFLNEASNSQIVHVATHSEVSEQDPLFSKIYLNSSENSQVQTALYAYELFDTNMSSDLIMLNSCSSGSGEYLQGTGIVGITRALRYAGANSLALNLWAVNDKIASEFATVFYTSINEGRSKTEAIRDAKLSLLENGNANPHFWGAYMLIGNPSPLTEKPAKAGFLFPLLFIVIGLVSLLMKNS
ncbi:MAG: CHAT domain-containing protein, partial [Balneolales bacterium]|nr:CHAT domain-containing protein [Balneolales bacterium]